MPTVRFGRVPKREKAKILAAMQSVNARSQERALAAELEDEGRLITTIVRAHDTTCDYTQEKVAIMLQRARENPIYTQCPPQLACPLNPSPQAMHNGNQRMLEDFSERFSPAIRGVVEFAKCIPGFSLLSQDDQVTLLKAGVFEVLLVRLACMFDSHTNTMLCLNGQVLKRESLHNSSNARFLMDSMFDFAERLNSLRLHDSEVGLFCAVVIITSDRPGLRNTELIEKMQSKLMQALQNVVSQQHPENPNIFQELIKKIPDLRTLNTLHSEKLLAFKMEPRNQEMMSASAVSMAAINNFMIPSWTPDYTVPSQGSEDSKGSWEERDLIRSPGQRSSAGSEWSTSESKDHDVFGSPRSSEPTPYMMEDCSGMKSPMSTVSGSGKGCGDNESICSGEVAQINELHSSKRRNENSHSEGGASSGDEGSVLDSPNKCPFKLRKLESPSDSGIESGKELGSNGSQSTSTSICGSPRSLIEEKVKEVDDPSDKSDPTDDMPVLKRALQAPPLINTNLLMDEAYKPHKKFRALRKDSDVPPSSDMPPQTYTNGGSLASTHSMLVKTLEQGPRMSEQQLKRTDIIHTIIMRSESRSDPSSTTVPSLGNPANGPSPQQNNGFIYGMPAASQIGTAPTFVAPSQSMTHIPNQKNIVVCAPNYYIPQQNVTLTTSNHYQSNSASWPFVAPSTNGPVVSQSMPARSPATYVPSVQPVVMPVQQPQHHQQQQQQQQSPITQHLLQQQLQQPHQPRIQVASAQMGSPLATSPQPTANAQLPRMYYDPRSSTPTSVGHTSPVSASPMPSYSTFGAKSTNSKPMSPAIEQVVELQVDVTENQPLNLSKRTPPSTPNPVHQELQRIKIETV